MSKSRRDPRKAKKRRDRIRSEKLVRHAADRPVPDIETIPEPTFANPPLTGPKLWAQEMADEALEAENLEEALYLIRAALDLDPDCTDAQRHKVRLLPLGRVNRIRLMRGVVDKAERLLGQRFLVNSIGHIWNIDPARPYMRANLYLAQLLVESGALQDAMEVSRRILDLDPEDNYRMRDQLLALYLAANQLEDADSLFFRYPDEEGSSGSFTWARVQLQWLAGDLTRAADALQRAREVNPLIENYLIGAREFSVDPPIVGESGSESDARICAAVMSIAWEQHRGFREWVRARG